MAAALLSSFLLQGRRRPIWKTFLNQCNAQDSSIQQLVMVLRAALNSCWTSTGVIDQQSPIQKGMIFWCVVIQVVLNVILNPQFNSDTLVQVWCQYIVY